MPGADDTIGPRSMPSSRLPSGLPGASSPGEWFTCLAWAQPDYGGGNAAALRVVRRFQPDRRAVAHVSQPSRRCRGQRQAMFLENTHGLAKRILRNYDLSETDSALRFLQRLQRRPHRGRTGSATRHSRCRHHQPRAPRPAAVGMSPANPRLGRSRARHRRSSGDAMTPIEE